MFACSEINVIISGFLMLRFSFPFEIKSVRSFTAEIVETAENSVFFASLPGEV
jgi:hypothetical protein